MQQIYRQPPLFDPRFSSPAQIVASNQSWTKEKDASDNKLLITYENDIVSGEKYYTINLTSSGVSSAHGHNLDNTRVKIDYIRKGGYDVIDTGILEQAMWMPK